MAMVRVSTNHRISMELVPSPIYPGSSREAPSKEKTGEPGCSNDKTSNSNERPKKTAQKGPRKARYEDESRG